MILASRLTGAGAQSQTAIFLEAARPIEIATLISSAHLFHPHYVQ
jgi:hypothetical protein